MKKRLEENFLRYVAISSQSKAGTGVTPSSKGQLELARLLQGELEALGAVEIKLSEFGVLTAKIPANLPEGFAGKTKTVGFVAHLDTVDVNLNPAVHPQIVRNYDGGDICLNEEANIMMKASEHTELAQYVGQDLITTDGTSVLGADNKAAVAAIMTALERLTADRSLYHGDLCLAFVPDEEIGLVGAKKMNFADFPVDFAYTIDCCQLGEVVYETFNAGNAMIDIQGVSAHPMSAKGVMVNPTLVAVDFIQLFDRLATPENTENTEGYIWVKKMESNQSKASLLLNIRDHSKQGYEEKKRFIREAAEFIQKRYPRAKVSCVLEDVYGNIADAVTEENRSCIDYIYTAMKEMEIEPKTIAMRGGTDGSFISTQGILTPNFFTGGHNFHSNMEFLPIDSFEKSYRMVLSVIRQVYENA